jgi:hypothetical protein
LTHEQRLFWKVADQVKRRLFNKLRDETQRINYLDYHAYQQAFEDIHKSLADEWKKIQEEFKNNRHFKPRLRGYLFEALFYYACLKTQAVFLDGELAGFGGAKFEGSPPWFEATPLYDFIVPLHHVKEGVVRKRRVPQTEADFLVTYVTDSGPFAPSMVDVKSRKPSKWDPKWGWQVPAAMRRGFTFQIAYPRNQGEYPKELEDWETATPCSKCRKLSSDPRKCSECGDEIYPFTIADAYYEAKDLWSKVGKERKGRF